MGNIFILCFKPDVVLWLSYKYRVYGPDEQLRIIMHNIATLSCGVLALSAATRRLSSDARYYNPWLFTIWKMAFILRYI